jgi:hypothetical protein
MAGSDRDTSIPAGERDPDFLTEDELAARLDADVQIIRALAAADLLPGQQISGRWLFRQAAVSARIAERGIDVGDFLTAEQLAAPDRLGMDVQTVRDLAARHTLPGTLAGRRWLFSWTAIYTLIAGPGVPLGEVLSARQLARRFGVPVRVVQRAAAPPGTPGKLPGYQVGKQWRFALEAVRQYLGGNAGDPGVLPRPSLSGSGQQGATPG